MIWDTLVRWRTYFLNGLLALAFILPEVLNSPEILAVIPPGYQRWFLVGAFLLNIWMRPRPAARASDAEVQVANLVSAGDSVLVIDKASGTKAIIDA